MCVFKFTMCACGMYVCMGCDPAIGTVYVCALIVHARNSVWYHSVCGGVCGWLWLCLCVFLVVRVLQIFY